MDEIIRNENEYAETERELESLRETYLEVRMPEEKLEALKNVMAKGKEENRKERKRRRRKLMMESAAMFAIAFIILSNSSVEAANALEGIPVLGNLVKVVTFRNFEYADERHQAEVDVAKLKLEEMTEEGTETTGNLETTEEAESAEPMPPQARSAVSDESGRMAKQQLSESIEEINSEIEEITDKLIEEFETYMQEEMGYQDLIISSEVVATTKDYFTLKLLCYQGAGSGYQWNYYYTIDLKSGKRLELKDIFIVGADYITPISENIKEQMKEQMAADENVSYWLDGEVEEWNFNTITEETSFYINEAGNVVISFNEGDVAPMSMGVVEFEIPAQVISNIRK